MKTLKFLSMAIMCMAMVLVSCTGDRGETGPQGKQGIAGADGANGGDGADGTDGISCWDLNGNGVGDADEDINDDGNFDALDCQGADGTNGVNGSDGNANVQAFNILLTDFSGTNLPFTIPMDPVDLPNYAMLFYLTNKNNVVYAVPGPMEANLFYTRLFYNQDSSNGSIQFVDSTNDAAYNISAGYFINLKIIAIETTTGAKNAQQSIMDELKAAGVDTNDYDAVAEYFGLDK
ncbi:MAG: hypothetical protein ACTHOM_04415 [Allomuricauda sp.]|uniref:Collagen-like protein n=1 Tax=Flagellimonas profundi TaxID=2915620 RepID=A0ABS3FGE4_9FLAO|nr:hypothetical protein [Allomuricauda profundi]MBO0342224.1 hypothetical protein [Allomuricauda profundi]